MNNGAWSLKTAGASANEALATTIAAEVVDPTLPTGSIGSLTSQLHRGTSVPLIGIVDFGRGDITILKQSSNNSTRVKTAMLALSGVVHYKFIPDDYNVGSPTWRLYSVSGGVTETLQSVNGIGIFADPDERSAQQLALASIVEPTLSPLSGASLISALDKKLADIGMEGFFVIDEKTPKEFHLFLVSDTSATSSFQDGSLANLDANSHVATYNVAPSVTGAASSSPI